MSNPIKYSTGTESLALKKGNFYIGTGDVGKGPTSSTGYYNGISPPSGGYTIYLNKETGGPSIYTASNDAQLISLTNSIAGQSYTTVNECLVYFAGQTDKMVLNRNYEGIVTNGLVLNLDAGFTPSYSRSGTTWYDVGGTNNGTLINGPSYESNNGGIINFDSSDDYIEITQRNTDLEFQPTDEYSCFVFFNFQSSGFSYGPIISNMEFQGTPAYPGWDIWFDNSSTIGMHLINNWSSNAIKVTVSNSFSNNQWYCFGYTYDGSSPTNSTNSLNSVNFYLNGNLHTSGKSDPVVGGGGFNSTSETISYNPNQRFRVSSRWLSTGPAQKIPIKIGNVLVYSRALSADEILQNFNAQKGRFGL
jgi:hypothetical protein